jgi:hypothetical protein
MTWLRKTMIMSFLDSLKDDQYLEYTYVHYSQDDQVVDTIHFIPFLISQNIDQS